MQLVLLTFCLFFSILRIGYTITAEKAGTERRNRHGTFSEYRDRFCDIELEEYYESIVNSGEDQFDDIWDLLEESKTEYADKIALMSERTQKVWNILVDGKRKPFSIYSYRFEENHGFKHYYPPKGCTPGEHAWNSLRAVYCFMSLHDKVPLSIARADFDNLNNHRKKIDYEPLTDWYPERCDDIFRKHCIEMGRKCK